MMEKDAAKKAYEDYFKRTQPADQSATQIIEMRRAFMSGMAATMFLPMASDADAAQLHAELQAFFESEVESGHGIPPE